MCVHYKDPKDKVKKIYRLCRFVDESGVRCEKSTSHPTGFCTTHRGKMEKYYYSIMLKCKDCPIRHDCDRQNTAPMGLCYFELYDRDAEYQKKEHLTSTFRKILQSEYRLVKRMERLITHDPEFLDKKLLGHFLKAVDNHILHLDRYGRFRGWVEPKLPIEQRKEKLRLLRDMFKLEKKKEKALIEVEVTE